MHNGATVGKGHQCFECMHNRAAVGKGRQCLEYACTMVQQFGRVINASSMHAQWCCSWKGSSMLRVCMHNGATVGKGRQCLECLHNGATVLCRGCTFTSDTLSTTILVDRPRR